MGGSFRFLQRIWTLAQEFLASKPHAQADVADMPLKQIMHRTTMRVSEDLERLSFNTAIAAMMEAVNELYRLKNEISYEDAPESWRWAIETLLQLLAPFAPHIAEELWAQLGHEESIHTSQWPAFDKQYLVSDTMTIVVQVNGKLRSQLELAVGTSKPEVIAAAEGDQKVAAYLAGKTIRKSIYIPGKLVNLVV
jgi:leucyl-tRNA synthetase